MIWTFTFDYVVSEAVNWLKIEVPVMQKRADFFWVFRAHRGTSFDRIWFVTQNV